MSAEQLLPINGVELAAQSFGNAGDPAILLIMGAAASMLHWDDAFCEQLAAGGRHVVRYDHRDTGRSTTRPPGEPDYTSADLVTDAAGLLDALELSPVHLVGMSMGSEIAQQLAHREPERVASLTLMSGTPGRTGPDGAKLPGMSDELTAMFNGDDAAKDADDGTAPGTSDDDLLESLVDGERLFGGPLFDAGRSRELYRRTIARSHDVTAGNNHFMVPEGAMSQAPASSLNLPTLVIHGRDDPLFPLPHGEALAASIPGARLMVLDGVGHEAPPPSTYPVVIPALLGHTTTD